MTDRERQLIENYIPSPKDPTLEPMQYYVMDLSNRVQKVEITDILPRAEGGTIYRVVQADTRRKVLGWRDYDGFVMSEMYDNKQDCRDYSHSSYDNWEALREIQEDK